jgi:hypothetical protein
MTDAERILALKAALVRIYSQACIECAAGGNGFDEMVRDVAGDVLAADLNASVEASA